jgi:hypothetical protein
VLAYRPWELAYVEGQAFGRAAGQLHDRPVHWSAVDQGVDRAAAAPAGGVSLPEDASALTLRRECHALARLVYEIAATIGKAIELRVLQSWDVPRIAGHGLPAGLVLEHDTGRHDLVSSRNWSTCWSWQPSRSARVLELTLPRRVEDPPTLSAPALSGATPPANRNSFARLLNSKWRWP